MLNELRTLQLSLNSCGVRPPPEHPAVRRLKKADGLVVGIDENGLPQTVEYRPANLMKELWTVQPDNHHGFPSINLGALFGPDAELENRRGGLESDDLIEELYRIAEGEPIVKLSALAGKLSDYSRSLESCLASSPALAAHLCLAKRLAKVSPRFISVLCRAALAATREGTANILPLAETLVVGKWSPKKRQFNRKEKALVFFDLSDYAAFGSRVARVDIGDHLKRAMLAADTVSAKSGRCSLTGRTASLLSDKFPQPNLPTLGLTYLFSANRDTPCQHNYGVSGPSAFSVGEATVREVNSGLAYITDARLKGKTWQVMPDDRGPRLVLAYVREREFDLELASLLVEAPSELSEASYEETCRVVCEALRARSLPTDAVVDVIVLAKSDPGRAAVQHVSYTVERVLSAAQEWQKAGANSPPYFESIGAESRYPQLISPKQVADLTQTTWLRGGSHRARVRGVPIDTVYQCFLGEGELRRQAVGQLLAAVLQRHTGLLTAQNANRSAQIDRLALVVLLGILLYKLGREKEVFMQEAAYNIGRLFALADLLHREYCQHVREGSMPPQLIGNGLMRTAIESPMQGMARLAERILPYQAWASTAKGREGALAKWALAQLGDVTQRIREHGLPSGRPTDAMKSEILLGYLARTGKKEEQNESVQ